MSTESMQNPCGAGVFVIGATSHVRIRISTTSHHTHTCNEIEGSYDKKSISPLHIESQVCVEKGRLGAVYTPQWNLRLL